jgi:hypothetical protein
MSGEETLFLGIRSATLGASLLMVAFVAATHVALKWWTRRRYRREVARSDDHPGEERGIAHWVASSLLDLVAPVARTSRRPVRAHHRHGDPSAAVPAAAVSREPAAPAGDAGRGGSPPGADSSLIRPVRLRHPHVQPPVSRLIKGR